MYRIPALALLCSFTFGCAQSGLAPAAPGAADPDVEDGARVAEGSPAALGMLAFLNDASTTYELLDDQVGLDRRAAESIIAHRNGPDGELGWLQDDLFDTIDEVDRCYYVGNTALGLIEEWAHDNGWVALDDDDVLGSWDGVTFTVAEAEAVLELANTAGADYLDDDLAMDSRAVNSIVDARPIESMPELAGLYYVGKTALNTLKDAAPVGNDCEVEGWDIEYVYDEGDGAWRDQLNAGLVDVVDEVLDSNDWCEESPNEVWFVKATVDRFNCEEMGYTIELGQEMVEYPGSIWYIEFTVETHFGYEVSACEV